MKVRGVTVGPVAENCYIIRQDESPRAVLVDPGDEPALIKQAIEDLEAEVEVILITHTHFDHVGAVASLARETKAPVYCPKLERSVLADIMSYVPWPGFGPFESYEADETVAGGEKLSLAGFEISVLFAPGHSPGHVCYWLEAERAIFSGDVLFAGSIGRTDLPGSDSATLMTSLKSLVDKLPLATTVYPGHMEPTTMQQEVNTNPFLQRLV